MVKFVQEALKLPFQPDERAANINQVFFADPSRPTWRLFVAKINEATIGVSVVGVKSTGVAPTFPTAEQLFPTAPNLNATVPNGTAVAGSSLRSEIEAVEKSGRFIALPTPQVTRTQMGGASSGLTTNATRVVRNGTGYQLRVVFTGPVDREITLESGASQAIILAPGQYKVLGRVSAPNVTPFLGPQTYNSGETYTSEFVIR